MIADDHDQPFVVIPFLEYTGQHLVKTLQDIDAALERAAVSNSVSQPVRMKSEFILAGETGQEFDRLPAVSMLANS